MGAIIPGMLLVGWAINPFMLYLGLIFYSFGTCLLLSKHNIMFVLGAGTVVSALTTIASKFGKDREGERERERERVKVKPEYCLTIGEDDEKGKVMGIFRSLGALARALGPIVACTGMHYIIF